MSESAADKDSKKVDYQSALERAKAIAQSLNKKAGVVPSASATSGSGGNGGDAAGEKRQREDENSPNPSSGGVHSNDQPQQKRLDQSASPYGFQQGANSAQLHERSQQYSNYQQQSSVHSRGSTHGGAGGDEASMLIPQSCVGFVIGKGGDTLKGIERESNTHIQVTKENDASGLNRKVVITGQPRDVELAKSLISEKVAAGEARSGGGGSGGYQQQSQQPPYQQQQPYQQQPYQQQPYQQQQYQQQSSYGGGGGGQYGGGSGGGGQYSTEVMLVPASKVGLVIGRQAATLNDIKSRSGARIFIPNEQQCEPGAQFRDVSISGTPDAIAFAKQLIEEKIGGMQQQNNGPRNVSETMDVPADARGVIIGRGGETIKALMKHSNCLVKIEQPMNGQCKVLVAGDSKEWVEYAKQLVQSVLDNGEFVPPADPSQDYYGGAEYYQQPALSAEQYAASYGQQAADPAAIAAYQQQYAEYYAQYYAAYNQQQQYPQQPYSGEATPDQQQQQGSPVPDAEPAESKQ